ncbi:hypothetical protein MC885_013263 [Smutsia gigantea]|nr:hypothetical protein MC885_013263 [Smutsia gigantea]
MASCRKSHSPYSNSLPCNKQKTHSEVLAETHASGCGCPDSGLPAAAGRQSPEPCVESPPTPQLPGSSTQLWSLH